MKRLHVLLLLLLLWLSLCVQCIRKNADIKKKSGLIRTTQKKIVRFTRLYKKSFKLKEEEVIGRYEVKAYFFFDESFEKRFKWNLYYKFCKSNTPSICNYVKLRRQFEKCKYSILQFDIKLEANNILKINKVPNLSDILMESLTNLISRKKLKPPSDIPSWRLSFNYITGTKKLVAKIPSQVPGMNFYFFFVMPAFRYLIDESCSLYRLSGTRFSLYDYSRLFSSIGDIYFKYEWGFRKYKVGYFTMEQIK